MFQKVMFSFRKSDVCFPALQCISLYELFFVWSVLGSMLLVFLIAFVWVDVTFPVVSCFFYLQCSGAAQPNASSLYFILKS